jgi:hypothetical protein
MAWSREDIEWLEREWAYRAYGRAGLMSPEDFQTWRAWEAEGHSVDLVVSALNAYFDRRDKRARPRTFVALKHLAKDVEKAVKLRDALRRAGPELAQAGGWESVAEPLQADAAARAAFEAWRRAQAALPDPTDPDYLERHDAVRAALADLVARAEAALGPASEPLKDNLRARLVASQLQESSPLWARAWKHHWAKAVLDHFHVPAEA